MIVEIPTRNDFAHYEYTIPLEDVVYTLDFRFNQRMNRWLLAIKDSDGNTVLDSTPIFTSWPIGDRFILEGLPGGVFMAFDTRNEGKIPERSDLGSRVILMYNEPVTA